MNQDQITCLESYLKIFKNTVFGQPSFYEASGYNSIGSIRSIQQLTKNKADESDPAVFMDLGKNINGPYKNTDYDFNCLFQFYNINKKRIASFFENNNYNYNIINEAINAIYKVGKAYGLFDSMEKITDVKLHNFFKAPYQAYGKSNKLCSTEGKVSEVNFTDFFKTAKNTSNGKMKSRRVTIYYKFVIKDGEVHPFALITFPVSINHKQTITLDIHPSGKEFNDVQMKEGLKELDETLKERIDIILRKELKLKNKFLDTLAFEDKLNYLKVAEMSKI